MRHHPRRLSLCWLVATACLAASAVEAQTSEGFETGLPSTAPTTATNYTLGSGTWTLLNASKTTTGAQLHGGLAALKLNTGVTSYADTPSFASITTVSFWIRGSGASTLTIQKSVGGGAFTAVATQAISSSYAQYTVNVNASGGVRVRFLNNATAQTHYMDDVVLGTSGGTATPTATPTGTTRPTATPTTRVTATPTARARVTATPTATTRPTATPTSRATATPTATPTSSGGSNTAYNQTGFSAYAGNQGGGNIPDTDARYKKVYNGLDLWSALKDNNTRVIEVMNDLSLGWNELAAGAKASPFAAHATPKLHPVLLTSGVTKITIQDRNAANGRAGLTIFSANGSTIRKAAFTIKRCEDVIIRNLKFDELWEWDESSKGNYDTQDWDYITLEENDGVWVDHCEFGRAYDGQLDIKKGTKNTTVSWCRFRGDDGSANSWVRQQMNALEANRSANVMYNYFRTAGMTVDQMTQIAGVNKKVHLVGATEFDAANADLWVTLHHNVYENVMDRLPRLRGGNVHVYNIYVKNQAALAAKKLRETFSGANNSSYHFDVFLNGSISTEGGAVQVDKSVYVDVETALRNNQTDPSNSTYTGKIRGLDCMYSFDGSAMWRGNSTDSGAPMGPAQAPVIAFSWNSFGSLPYTVSMDDPSTLVGRLTASDGAGAGKLTWAKSNWLVTTY